MLNQTLGIKTSCQDGMCTIDEAVESMILIGYSNEQVIEIMKTWDLSAHSEPEYVAWLSSLQTVQ